MKLTAHPTPLFFRKIESLRFPQELLGRSASTDSPLYVGGHLACEREEPLRGHVQHLANLNHGIGGRRRHASILDLTDIGEVEPDAIGELPLADACGASQVA